MSTITLQRFATGATTTLSHCKTVDDHTNPKALRPAQPVNPHWGAFVDTADHADHSQPRRVQGQGKTNFHWAALVEDEDEDEELEEEESTDRRRQTVNSHWGAIVGGGDEDEGDDMDEEESTSCRRRRQPVSSHWGSCAVEEEDNEFDLDHHESEADNNGAAFADQWKRLLDGSTKSTKEPSGAVDKSSSSRRSSKKNGTESDEKTGKTKRYTRNKPRLPTAFELKYRKSPTNMAAIVLPMCAEHTLVRPSRPGMVVRTGRKSELVHVITAY